MPKNQFQRPLPVKHTANVPRHGKPLPERKAEPKRQTKQPQSDDLPPLQALLARDTRP